MGHRHGYWEEYHENGLLWYKGNFINGNLDGYWEWYNINGKLLYNGKFKDGHEQGYWVIDNQEHYYARM